MVVKKDSVCFKLAYWYSRETRDPQRSYSPLLLLRILLGVSIMPVLAVISATIGLAVILLVLLVIFFLGIRPPEVRGGKVVPIGFLPKYRGISIMPLTIFMFAFALFASMGHVGFWIPISWVLFISVVFGNIFIYVPPRQFLKAIWVVEFE